VVWFFFLSCVFLGLVLFVIKRSDSKRHPVERKEEQRKRGIYKKNTGNPRRWKVG